MEHTDPISGKLLRNLLIEYTEVASVFCFTE